MIGKQLTLLTVGFTALAGSGAAQAAGYYVSTTANTGRSYDRGCAAQYNAGRTGAAFIINDGSGAPCPTMPFNGQTAHVSGSTDTTGKLTASHDASSVVSMTDADTAYASASADLATGKVHLYNTSSSPTQFAGTNADARLNDTLHFTIAGANASTVTLIPISFAFDGTMPGTRDPMHSSAELNYGFFFGGAYAYEFGDYQAGYYGYSGRYTTFTYDGAVPRVGGWQSYSFASYDPLNTQFTGVYAITGATADIAIDFDLALRSSNLTLDFSHTGKVDIGKVAGVSYTSDSGVFLTATGGATGAVPEPAAWALMIVGFGFTGFAVRRRGQRSLAA